MKYLILIAALLSACSSVQTSQQVPVKQGDLAKRNGTATVRKPFESKADDPNTTNNESNDQPLGHFGTTTITVHNVSSGNTYDLDADFFEGELLRLYFPKGGWVDFEACDPGVDLENLCVDENGKQWEVVGTP